MKGGLLLDVVIGESPAVLQLLASKDQPLLVWGNSLLVLDKITLLDTGTNIKNQKSNGSRVKPCN